MSVETAVAALLRIPERLEVARDKVPKAGGLYAWWVERRAIAGVPERRHPTEPHLALLYVGIAPSRVRSSATLRSRVVRNHIRGNIAASTFRLTLAALLRDKLELTPIRRGKKVVLPADQNLRLSHWQHQHLSLSWHEAPNPWDLERAVIAALAPPLNLAENQSHTFFKTLSDARAALRHIATSQP